MAAARAMGNTGKVTGIDIAEKMLDVARAKAKSAGLSNVEYRLGDAEALEFNDATFDAVICATAIYLLRDIPKALHEWHRVLEARGTVAFIISGRVSCSLSQNSSSSAWLNMRDRRHQANNPAGEHPINTGNYSNAPDLKI
jgi:ubiquinone/menaquinone biosynthesis C-methylase UbiE